MLQRIFKLEDDQGVVVGDDCLKCHITNYYKNLFGQPEASGVSLFKDLSPRYPSGIPGGK
jgi:hypothetical protein